MVPSGPLSRSKPRRLVVAPHLPTEHRHGTGSGAEMRDEISFVIDVEDREVSAAAQGEATNVGAL